MRVPRDEQHVACPESTPWGRKVDSHWHEESSATAQLVEPTRQRFGGPGIDENRVEGLAHQLAPVSPQDGDIRPAPEVLPGALRQPGVKLDAHYGAVGNRRRRNCRVVSDTAADVKESIREETGRDRRGTATGMRARRC